MVLREGEPKESHPFIPRPVDRRAFDLATEPWKSNATLREQLGHKPFRGEGFLYHATTEQLRETLGTLTKDWQDAAFIQDVAGFAADVHKNDKRKDGETPYEHHLLRIAIRIAQMDYANAERVADALMHDTVEDHNVTLEQMQHHQHLQKYPVEKLEILHEVAAALSNKKNDGKLSTRNYYKKIDRIHEKYPERHCWILKGVDRLDNTNADNSFAVRHANPRPAAEKVKRYRAKTRQVMPYIEKYEPDAPVLNMLRDAWNLQTTLMNEHGLRDKRLGFKQIGSTIFTRA